MFYLLNTFDDIVYRLGQKVHWSNQYHHKWYHKLESDLKSLHLTTRHMTLKVHVISTRFLIGWRHILHLIGPQNLHRLTTNDNPATCKPEARISFANLFSLHIFLQYFKNTNDPTVLRNFIAYIGTWGNYFNMGNWGKLWEFMGNLGASDFIVWKPLNVFWTGSY